MALFLGWAGGDLSVDALLTRLRRVPESSPDVRTSDERVQYDSASARHTLRESVCAHQI